MRMTNRSVWQKILPLLKVSLKKYIPTGLSIISGKSEPMSRSLISKRVAKDVKGDVLLLKVLCCERSGWEESRSCFLGAFARIVKGRFLKRALLSSTAAPRVIPVCPSMSILLILDPSEVWWYGMRRLGYIGR